MWTIISWASKIKPNLFGMGFELVTKVAACNHIWERMLELVCVSATVVTAVAASTTPALTCSSCGVGRWRCWWDAAVATCRPVESWRPPAWSTTTSWQDGEQLQQHHTLYSTWEIIPTYLSTSRICCQFKILAFLWKVYSKIILHLYGVKENCETRLTHFLSISALLS